jgi:SpoU rRNA methylase family enzyme
MATVSIDFFDGLPPELIAFVVGYVPAWQRAAVRCTNKRICKIVNDMPNRCKSFLTHRSFALPFSTPEYLEWLEDTRPGKVDWTIVSIFVGHYFPRPFAVYNDVYKHRLCRQETADGVSESGNCVVLISYLQDGVVDKDVCLSKAAAAGQLEAIRLLFKMGATDFNGALRWAAMCGQLEAMCLAVKMGATDFNEPLGWAAQGGYLEAMRLLVEMGATDFNGALIWAAVKGQLDAMSLAVEMGATHFNEPLGWAAQGGHLEAMRLAVKMGATNFNLALRCAAKSGQLEAMRLAVKMGATAFNDALWDVIFRDHSEAVAYMQKLIAERD